MKRIKKIKRTIEHYESSAREYEGRMKKRYDSYREESSRLAYIYTKEMEKMKKTYSEIKSLENNISKLYLCLVELKEIKQSNGDELMFLMPFPLGGEEVKWPLVITTINEFAPLGRFLVQENYGEIRAGESFIYKLIFKV